MIDVAHPDPHASTTIPTITTRAWTFAPFGKAGPLQSGLRRKKNRRCRRSETPATVSPVQYGPRFTRPNRRLSTQGAVSVDVLLRDRHLATDTESAAGDF